MKHPPESDLALLAAGDCGPVNRFFLRRHVRECRHCTEAVARYEILRQEMVTPEIPDLNWDRLESEMRANIRLGLEAGECVRLVFPEKTWNARLVFVGASLMILAAAGVFMKAPVTVKAAEPTIESTGAGVELINGASSMTLLNRNGSVAEQTVSAQGEIRARYVDGGAVTINNVYLE